MVCIDNAAEGCRGKDVPGCRWSPTPTQFVRSQHAALAGDAATSAGHGTTARYAASDVRSRDIFILQDRVLSAHVILHMHSALPLQ